MTVDLWKGVRDGLLLFAVALGLAGAWVAVAGEPDPLQERRCSADADCAEKVKRGTLRKDRSYICLGTYCQFGCRTDKACMDATGNNLARCVSGNCYLPAWMAP